MRERDDLKCAPLCFAHPQRKIFLSLGQRSACGRSAVPFSQEGACAVNGSCRACFRWKRRRGESRTLSVKAYRLCHTPPFVAARHFPPAGGNLSSKGEALAWRQSFRLSRKACGRPRSPLGELPPQRLRGFKWRTEKKVQRRRPPPAADAGRSCWGSGQQDTSAAQGTKWTLGTATRLSEAARFFPVRLPLWGY